MNKNKDKGNKPNWILNDQIVLVNFLKSYLQIRHNYMKFISHDLFCKFHNLFT